MKRWFIALGLLLWLGEPAAVVAQCPYDSADPAGAYDRASAVFVGTVLHLERVPGTDHPIPRLRVTLRVQDNGKNADGDTITIETPLDQHDCGYPFEVGRQYFVYAVMRAGALITTTETRTNPIAWALADLEELRRRTH